MIHGELPSMQTSQSDCINHREPFCSILVEYQSLPLSMCGSPGEANPAVVSVPAVAHFAQPNLLSPLWTLRNEERHGWDKESCDNAKREVLNKELEEIYSKKNEYPRRVQRLLKPSYDLHIQGTVQKIEDWLDTYKGTFAITWSPD